MFTVWNKLLSPLCEQPLCPSVTGYTWNLARTDNLKPFQTRSEKSMPEWFVSIKRGTGMCPLFNILDHVKKGTHCLVPKMCWEKTGLLTRNRALLFVRPQRNLKQTAFWAKHSESSGLWEMNSCKESSPCCKSHSEELNGCKSIQGTLALPWG